MSMRSAVTVCLVPEAAQGPFVFHGELLPALGAARELGFAAVEIFPPDAAALPAAPLRKLLGDRGLALAAVGTGAGWLRSQLTLTSADAAVRRRAEDFIAGIVEAAGALGAPAIIGSMQGRWAGDAAAGFGWLGEALARLGERARTFGVPLLYEPLNRYETNLCNTLASGAALLEKVGAANVKLLADLFHMNIEETDWAAALRGAGPLVGHVHLADSHRGPAGTGHTDFAPIAVALRDIGYAGFVSAECFPQPDSPGAAAATMAAFQRHFAG